MLPSRMPSPEPVIGSEVTPATSLAARVVLEQTVWFDSRSVLAWSRLATCYISDYKYRWNEAGKEEIGAGQDLVRRAREALAGKLTRLTRTWLSPGMPKALSAASREGIKKDTRLWIGPLATRTSPPHMRKKPINWSASGGHARRCRSHAMQSSSLVPMINPPELSTGCSDAPTSY